MCADSRAVPPPGLAHSLTPTLPRPFVPGFLPHTFLLSSVTVLTHVLSAGLCSALQQPKCKLHTCVEALIYTHLCSVLHWEELRHYSFFKPL